MVRPSPHKFAALHAALAQGATSALAQTKAALAAIATQNKKLHAFVEADNERALADARHVDALVALGRDPGPLAGAILGVKDIIDVEGLHTRAGSRTRAEASKALRDAPVVARLRGAGAIIIGKTHTVEYAFGGWGTNVAVGTPYNPRDMKDARVPGGSSSGSGVAVAAGLCQGALGSDTGGSIRLPASFCGIVGLKTTQGLIDITGVLPLTPMFDTLGPMTNCVADAAAMLAVMAPPQNARSPGWSAEIDALAKGHGADVKGLRIGVVANLGVALHADVARAFENACARLEAAGAAVSRLALPQDLAALAGPCGEIMAAEAFRHYGRLAEAEPCLIGAPVRARILSGKSIAAHRLMALFDDRAQRKAEIARIFQRYDALLTPTTPYPAPTLAELDETALPGLLTRWVNYLDLAALSLPFGATAQGLPIGVQIVAPGWCEPMALRIGAALET